VPGRWPRSPICTTDDNGNLRVSGLITEKNLSPGWTLDSLIELMESGNSYVNVHTDLNFPGKIRG